MAELEKKRMADMLDILELNSIEIENSTLKNSFIGQMKNEWVGFVDEKVTNNAEIEAIFDENEFLKEYDVVVFGENIPEGEAGLADVLEHFDMSVFGIVLQKKILIDTGCFNTKLKTATNYEFLCRVARSGKVYGVPCASEEARESHEQAKQFQAITYAYVLCNYMVELKEMQLLDRIFSRIVAQGIDDGYVEFFYKKISEFLEKSEEYRRIINDTAPFFVVFGDETCYGVLNDFALSLSNELIAMGQAVMISDPKAKKQIDYEVVRRTHFKGIIGFQAPALESEFFRKVDGKKFQFWFDNPVFFNDMFRKLGPEYYILCQDQFYANHIRYYYGAEHAIQFPPAGKVNPLNVLHCEKEYDVVFIGTYNPDQSDQLYETVMDCYRFAINHPKLTFEESFEQYLKSENIYLNKEQFLLEMWKRAKVFHTVINYYRKKVIETILSAGIKVHVYGDSWKQYEGKGKENLVLHPQVSVEESLEILSKAKIGLNVMTWHKAGMTERIANIMLSGAVCVSDETTYLHENFSEDEIVLFALDKLELLPEQIRKILENDELRNEMAKNAYEKAMVNHTWRKRAQELLEIADIV